MSTLLTEPIRAHWTGDPLTPRTSGSAADAVGHLARFEIADLDPALSPVLAAAAAELAAIAGIAWRRGGDDPPVVLVRLIAHVAARAPAAGGPQTARLLAELEGRPAHRVAGTPALSRPR